MAILLQTIDYINEQKTALSKFETVYEGKKINVELPASFEKG